MNKFIHQLAVVYLAIIIMIRMMAMPISLIDYSLNKKFITGNLCENRLRPEMHCAGKCYLNKQLTRANDNQESKDQKGAGKSIVIDYFEPLVKPSFCCLSFTAEYSHHFKPIGIPCQFCGNIFHPPIV